MAGKRIKAKGNGILDKIKKPFRKLGGDSAEYLLRGLYLGRDNKAPKAKRLKAK